MIGGFNKLPFLERQMELFCLHGMRFLRNNQHCFNVGSEQYLTSQIFGNWRLFCIFACQSSFNSL